MSAKIDAHQSTAPIKCPIGNYNPASVLSGRGISGATPYKALWLQADPARHDDAVGACLSVQVLPFVVWDRWLMQEQPRSKRG